VAIAPSWLRPSEGSPIGITRKGEVSRRAGANGDAGSVRFAMRAFASLAGVGWLRGNLRFPQPDPLPLSPRAFPRLGAGLRANESPSG